LSNDDTDVLEAPTPPARLSVPAGPLTVREREVAALVARGRTNLAIGHQLTISERTVEKHVANMLGKLELTSRAQLAVWVYEHLRGDIRASTDAEASAPG